jgi:hypothetical protein
MDAMCNNRKKCKRRMASGKDGGTTMDSPKLGRFLEQA